ncbi:MAG: Smr/MutS family protein [Gammaproteobacteria bacterium]|nr:Smr/MutS family protein [Gammaproteobacteria bacterium]MCY4218693.1 Smr/MutS family protein [Gammaproteobacteria bacterium]MCY4275213.1 Smr/MutS family protein [Gammaproteobacteria bacterium]
MSIYGDEDKRAWLEEIESVEPLHSSENFSRKQNTSPNISSSRQIPSEKRTPPLAKSGDLPSGLIRRKDGNPMVNITPTTGPVRYARSGIQKKIIDKLKQGQPQFEAKLDLHGYNRVKASQELELFFLKSIRSGYRCVLVIHGKGYHSHDQAVLRMFTMDWLKEINSVLAFCTAKQDDGGTGAVYVLLKKSQ